MRLILFLAFIVVPIVELAVIIQVGQVIGAAWTVLLLLGISIAGASLVKREGLRAWSRFRDALVQTRLPTREVVDGALILFAGALLLTPGFVTDAVGLLLLLPATRSLVNRALRQRVRTTFGLGSARRPGGQPPRPGNIIDVEVVDIERDDNPPPA